MIYRAYSIFDNGVAVFQTPFFVNHPQYALRYFETLAKDVKSDVSKYPSQFHLFEIGVYDDSTGILTMHDNHISLGLASSFMNPEV